MRDASASADRLISTTIYVGNLPFAVSEAELRDLLHLLHQVNPGKIISKVDPKHIIKTIHSRTSQYEARNSPKCSPQISPMKSHERKVSAFELKVREARRRGEAGPVQRSYSI